jgi:hypothetical protein
MSASIAAFSSASFRADAERRADEAVAMGDVVMLSPCGEPGAFDTSDPDVRRLTIVAGIASAALVLAGLALSLSVG